MTPQEILDTKIEHKGSQITLHTFFKMCLLHLVAEGECFSGKRPLGNSGWEGEIAVALGAFSGSPDDPDIDYAKARDMMIVAITNM